MKLRFVTLLAAAVFGCALNAQETTNPSAKPAPLQEKPKKASISGRVVNAKTGEALKKVSVMLMSKTGGKMTSAESDQSGDFTFSEVEAGEYLIMGDRQGFARQFYGARSNPYAGATLTVKAGQETKDVVFTMSPQAVITGRVTDEDGEPMNMIAVAAAKTTYVRGKKQLVPVGMAMTNDAGEYRLSNLAPGKYFIAASNRNMGLAMLASSSKPSDKAEPGYPMVFYPNSGDTIGAAPVAVSAGGEIRAIDIQMNKTPAVRVSGTVKGVEPGKMVVVTLMPKATGVLGASMGKISMAQAPEGKFEMKGVTPGSYTLAAVTPPADFGYRMQLEVGENNIDNLVLPTGAAAGAEVKGRIIAEGETQPKLGGVKIVLSAVETVVANATSTVADDGTFTLKTVAPDKYEVAIGDPPAGYYFRTVKFGGSETVDRQVQIAEGASGGYIEVVLSPNAASVEGVAGDKDGKPLSGVTVALIPKSGKSYHYRDSTTDQQGHFEFKNVVPGDYIALAWEEIELGAFQDPEFVKTFESKATKLEVKERAHEVLKLKTIPSETIAEEKQKGS